MRLHQVDGDVVALGVVVVGVLRVDHLEDLILRVGLDVLLHELDVRRVVRRRRRCGDEGHLAALRRVDQRAVEHGLGGLLVGHLVEEHVAGVGGGVRVESGDDDALLAGLLEHRSDGVEIDRGEDDGVGLLGQEVLEGLDLERDVGMVGAGIDELVAELLGGVLAALGRGFEIGEAGPLRRHHQLEAVILGVAERRGEAERQDRTCCGEQYRACSHVFLLRLSQRTAF